MLRLAPSPAVSLLLLVTALFTFLIQSGELGTSDTTHRLQVAHSLWTSQPQVFPDEYPEFGLHGRGGRLYAWYGIGQSLLMLPADLAGSAATHLPFLSSYASTKEDPAIRSIIVSISTNILVNVLTALAAFHLLALLGFSTRESVAGTLALLCATTHLHYAQNMTENNYILLLTLTGFALQYKWLVTGSRPALFWGSAALGLNLLTRLTTALDILAAACFILLALFFTRTEASRQADISNAAKQQAASVTTPNPAAQPTLRTYMRTALPIYAVFFSLDRLYQFIRFGSWSNTYVDMFAREQRQMDPSLPASFPFNGEWIRSGIDSGLLGPFLAPAKTVFLFDPMFLLALLLTALLWKRLTPAMRAFLAAAFLMLGAYIVFYAHYFWWAGDFAWGDRYISSAVELTTLLAIALLLRYRKTLGRTIWNAGLAITAASVAIQCASLAFWLPLEIYQMDAFGHHTFVVFLRFKNIAAFALGRRQAWGLNTPAMFEDPWDAAHITSWNFLPSLLRHIGVAPLWVVHVLDGVWFAVAVALVFTFARLVRSLCLPAAGPADSPNGNHIPPAKRKKTQTQP
ncbi:MAG TPA: hypothetical protein VNX17_12105 [Edaphobacter sp.]|nr:hypothetical protein [Edaphobacter sp.]